MIVMRPDLPQGLMKGCGNAKQVVIDVMVVVLSCSMGPVWESSSPGVGVPEIPSRGVGVPSQRVPSWGVPSQGVSGIPSPKGPSHKTILL